MAYSRENNTDNNEEEYIPPADRLITPPDVVAIDDEMTVYSYIIFG